MQSKRLQGTVKSFSKSLGYGYIQAKGQTGEIYFNLKNVENDNPIININDKVEFILTRGISGREALHIKILKEEENEKNS